MEPLLAEALKHRQEQCHEAHMTNMYASKTGGEVRRGRKTDRHCALKRTKTPLVVVVNDWRSREISKELNKQA